jgi:bla regulator protein BlaR1
VAKVQLKEKLMVQNAAGPNNHGGLIWLVMGALIVSTGPLVLCHESSAQPSATPPVTTASSQQMPVYDVATIKPAGVNEYASPLRVYIQGAFGIPVNSIGWVVGPDWINSTKYVIRGKPPESMQRAMQTMTAAERSKQDRLMKQALLADRFKLKAHFETREMPVYQLIVAKDGPKLKENPDSTLSRVGFSPSVIRGKAVPMHNLIDCLESVPDIGGRVVIDKTGLSATYDLELKWTPLDGTPSPDMEGATLFTAIEEQLGLKLVPAKSSGQVLVIDHIEPPSES